MRQCPISLREHSVTAYDRVKLEISVVLGRSVMQVSQLLKMGRGAVIELDTMHDDPVQIYANQKLIAHGEIVIVGDKIGVSVIAPPKGLS